MDRKDVEDLTDAIWALTLATSARRMDSCRCGLLATVYDDSGGSSWCDLHKVDAKPWGQLLPTNTAGHARAINMRVRKGDYPR